MVAAGAAGSVPCAPSRSLDCSLGEGDDDPTTPDDDDGRPRTDGDGPRRTSTIVWTWGDGRDVRWGQSYQKTRKKIKKQE